MLTAGPAKEDFLVVLAAMGELTDVASAKRAVLGVCIVSPDEELDEVLGRTVTAVSFFSPVRFLCGRGRPGSGFTGDTGS